MSDDIITARMHAKQAGAALTASIATLKARLKPRALVQEATDTVVEKTQAAARDGLATVRTYPLPVAGMVAAVALFLARRPIVRLLRHDHDDATPPPPVSLTTDRPRAAARRISR